ncbi:MAG: alpha/beta fold hydrolase [Stackebrandtia sp.]
MARSRLQNSTTVRLFSLLRLGFRVGERLAPGRAARLATRLWFRLPTQRRSRVPAKARAFELNCLDTTVRGYEWGDGRLVYLQHGWGGCVGDLDTIAACLVANGFRVVAVDAPSHGNSGAGPFGPKASSPLQISAALDAAIDKFGEPYAIVAHSMGCLATAISLRERVAPQRLVMVSTFIGGPLFLQLFAKQLGVGPRTQARFIALAEQQMAKPLSYFDITGSVVDSEALIIHDRHDRSAPFEHGELIAEAWPKARLHPTENLGHRRILNNPTIIGEIVDFLT